MHRILKRIALTCWALLLLSVICGSNTNGQGGQLSINTPLPDERFIAGETLSLNASLKGRHADPSQIVWTADHTQVLGHGPEVRTSGLSAGRHEITAALGDETQNVSIRVFGDLGELYQAIPSQSEVDRILKAFSFRFIDGSQPDEKWSLYNPPRFDQSSLQPSKLVILYRLDAMRHEAFSEPLPFGDGLPLYDHFRKYVNTIELRLDCVSSHGGGRAVSIGRLGSTWWNLYSGSAGCKVPGGNPPPLAGYVDPLYLLVHEGRHSEPGDPGHTTCRNEGNMDAALDHGSGHAWAALYLMWVYKYGLYDPPAIKEEAKTTAISLLRGRLCSSPASSNPRVQAIIDELLHR